MKKVALIVALCVLFAAALEAAVSRDDREFRTGLRYYNSRNYKEAVRHFREYVSAKPDPAAYYMLGYSLYKQGKFGEAEEYFSEAYLVDPEFSPEKAGLVKKPSPVIRAKEPVSHKEAVPSEEARAVKPEVKQPAPSAEVRAPEPAPKMTEPLKPQQPAPSVTPMPAMKEPAAPQQMTPQPMPPTPQPVQPPVAMPPIPLPQEMPPGATAALTGIMAAFGMVMVVIAIAFYVYYCLCMYLIAKKLNVPAPWTAWIPLVQIWTFVASAGKPGWWILLFLVPFVNMIVAIYLWMCITENLGKNKWLGLLILVPLVNFIYPAWLAFSKSEIPAGSGAVETLSE